MTLALLSNEMVIRKKLRELNCAESAFAAFNGIVARTRFFEGMRGLPGKHFSADQVRRLLEVLDEMRALQSDTPINWSDVERVKTALVLRRVNQIGKEIHAEENNHGS